MKQDLVCWSHLRWNFVFQRPQHLMVRWARSHRVVFVEEPVAEAGPSRLVTREDGSGVTVVEPHIDPILPPEHRARELERLCELVYAELGVRQPLAWYYTPMWLPPTRHLQARAIVYDCMDELTGFAGAPPELRAYEDELLGRAHAVFTGGQSLYEAKRSRHANVHALPSSVDVAHFAAARTLDTDPPDQERIPRPRIGFHGVIDERMDLALIDGIAELRPDWHLVLIGPVAKIDPATLPNRPNIHWLGMKTYAELPGYLAGWDVAMLPFALNDATRFISPTKTPEYMAGGLPVVSTPIRDVVRPYGEAGLVHIASDARGFVRAIERIGREDRVERRRRHDLFLSDLSWDRTFARAAEIVAAAK